MEWKTVKLGEIGEVVGGATPLTRNPVYYDGEISWITPKDLANYSDRYISRGERNITEEGYKSCSCKMLPKGSVLFSSRAPIGYIAIAENDLCTNQGFKSIIPNADKVDNVFLFYLLKQYKDYIAGLGSGTTFMEVSGSVMKNIELPLPPLDTQRRIAAILSSLDDKIENNNRINRNLEAQAQALFKSWFIDFEPWGGTMPDDWKEGTLGEICSFNKRKIGPKFANPIQYLDTGHLTEGVIEGYQRFYPGDKIPSSARRYVGEGDILFSLCRPNMRHYGLMMNPPEDIVASTGFAVITANWSGYRYYIYQWLKQDGIIDNIHAVAEQSSTTYPTIDVDYLAGMTMVIPSIADTDRYALLCRDLYSKIESNYQENLRLAALRDTLLPKLMKGEVIV